MPVEENVGSLEQVETAVSPESEKKPKTKKVKIAEMVVERCPEGLSVYIKSKTIEEFIKNTFGGTTAEAQTSNWARGHRFYKMDNGNCINIQTARHTVTLDGINNNALLINEDAINASFLRIVGITEGKTFKFNGLYRESDIGAIAQSFNEALKTLFKEYNTPVCYEIEVVAET